MDPKPCKHCSIPLYNGENRCPGCGKLQSHKTIYIGLSLIVAFALLCLSIFAGAPKSEDVVTTATYAQPASTTTPAITDTTTAATAITEVPIIPTPDPDYGWVKIQPGLWAKPYTDTTCFLEGYGVEYCAGETVLYYSTVSGWTVYYENPGGKIWIPITPGKVTYAHIPEDATLVRWEWH